MSDFHQSVFLEASIAGLNIQPDGLYIDGTFGRFGHTRAILNALGMHGRLFAFDKDEAALHYAKTHFSTDARFEFIHTSFSNLGHEMSRRGLLGHVQGVLLDLGVSSPQLDDASRGFSFLKTGPLDMRMNQQQEQHAASFINEASLDTMIHVFKTYGEERFARSIANAIINARREAPILTTTHLADVIKKAHPKWDKHKHPATRVFQAIRIEVNRELEDLTLGLRAAVDVLAPKGRLVVISFHSLEDRIVKQFMKHEEEGIVLPKDLPIVSHSKLTFQRIGKAVKCTDVERQENIRSRSAVLRIGEKLL